MTIIYDQTTYDYRFRFISTLNTDIFKAIHWLRYFVTWLRLPNMKIFCVIVGFLVLLFTNLIIGEPLPDNAPLLSEREYFVKRAFATGTHPICFPWLVANHATGRVICPGPSGLKPTVDIAYPINLTWPAYTNAHVWVGTGTPPANFDDFPYTIGHDCSLLPPYDMFCEIPISDFTTPRKACGKTFNMAVQADFNNSQIGTAGNKCIHQGCHPWFRYFTFTFTCWALRRQLLWLLTPSTTPLTTRPIAPLTTTRTTTPWKMVTLCGHKYLQTDPWHKKACSTTTTTTRYKAVSRCGDTPRKWNLDYKSFIRSIMEGIPYNQLEAIRRIRLAHLVSEILHRPSSLVLLKKGEPDCIYLSSSKINHMWSE